MKQPVQRWLADHASPPGTLACGLRQPDGALVCHSREDLCPIEKMEAILRQFESLRAVSVAESFAPRWWTWTFEHGQIRFVARSDGWILGVVIHPESEAASQLDPLSNEFLSLELGN